MEKRNIFLNTIYLAVAFGAPLAVLAYLLFHNITVTVLKFNMNYVFFGLPILLGFLVCRLINRRKFIFQKHLNSKHSWMRLLFRLAAVVVVLIAGYILCTQHWRGGYFIYFVLCNYFYYIIIAIFLLTFSVIELFFVP